MSAEIFTDIILVCIVLLSGLLAWFQGLVKEVLSIASWLGAIFVTSFAFAPVLPLVRDNVGWPEAAVPLTIGGLFLGSLIIFSILSRLVAKLVHGAGAGPLDRTLGFVFGLVRGALIVMVLFIAASAYVAGLQQQPHWFANSRAMQVAAIATKSVITWLPENMRKVLPKPVIPERRTALGTDRGSAPPGPSGYPSKVRQGLNRLFDGTNQGK
jgi:membrane protein required for colicin V production